MDFLNNREIAIIIWLLIPLTLLIFQKNIRDLFLGALKILLSKKIIIPILIMLLYIFFIVYGFHRIGLWDTSKIKDTIYWIFGAAFIMFFNSTKASEGGPFFRNAILDNLKLIVVLELIVNLYVFSLFVELILMPILFILILTVTYAEHKQEFAPAQKAINWILGIIGLSFILFAVIKIAIDFQGFANLDTLRSLLLPPILTLVYLPFIYFMALYIQYGNIFIRINILNESNPAVRYAKRKIIILCNINLVKLIRLSKGVELLRIKNKKDVLIFIQKYKRRKTESLIQNDIE